MMRIIIPTRGRVGRQVTVASLPRELRARTVLVCPATEAQRHWRNHPDVKVMAQPDDKMTIAAKRRWIVEEHLNVAEDERLVMLDDDLRFAVRREDDPEKFRAATPIDMVLMFTELEQQITADVPHAGFASRGGNQAQPPGWRAAKRMMYVLGLHCPTVLQNCELGRIETREDMDLTLQLLRKGFPNAVSYTYVVDQKYTGTSGAKAVGGTLGERTIESSNADALRLAEFHPGFVRVVDKAYSGSVSRKEVVCYWERALRDGQQRREAGAYRKEDGAGGRRRGPEVHRSRRGNRAARAGG